MNSSSLDSFKTAASLKMDGKDFVYFSLGRLEKRGFKVSRLPYSLKILLENLLRHEDGKNVTTADIQALASWNPQKKEANEIAFKPARVILQDFTGVPCIVDLATMRDALKKMGGNPKKINPLQPVELVIDHSVQVDSFGSPQSLKQNVHLEYQRNRERYEFLKWGQKAFNNYKVVPPGTGIVHQVNLEYLARVVMTNHQNEIYPDTLFGTDSHTTMINGLGVLGWGVGGIEAEAAMLGQSSTMLIPEVVGVSLTGALKEGVTATDLVLVVTQMLRKKGVVGKFVEFTGPGLLNLSLADRATVANMAPEYGATCGLFPVDEETLRYLALTGRTQNQINQIKEYLQAQGLFWTAEAPPSDYSDQLELDLGSVETSLAGPSRPQDRVVLSEVKKDFLEKLPQLKTKLKRDEAHESKNSHSFEITDGSVVIAAITSCTNTSNPSVLVAAGLLAKKANHLGLSIKPWVKTSLAPGSQVVTDYLDKAGLLAELEKLKFNVVGYGCTTCIGNSGPLPQEVSRQIKEKGVVAAAVLSGNRNFEGRIHSEVRANYLATPPLVVAYALAGRIDIDLKSEPLGEGNEGQPVYLKNIWPNHDEIEEVIHKNISSSLFSKRYKNVFEGDAEWREIILEGSETYRWDQKSTYIQKAPYFDGMTKAAEAVKDIVKARVLAVFGDSVTTDHISPAGFIKVDSPAGKYLQAHGIKPADFNSYGARRGSHEVMMRGTFANARIKNKLTKGIEGGITRYFPTNEILPIYDAAMKYQKEKIPLIIIAGKEYGSGSSRDWAAKGPALQGVKGVIVESFERIHRSNLVGMGLLPLQFLEGQNRESLGLSGEEFFTIEGLADLKPRQKISVKAQKNTSSKTFDLLVRIDTPMELEYYRHGGILPYVLRQLL